MISSGIPHINFHARPCSLYQNFNTVCPTPSASSLDPRSDDQPPPRPRKQQSAQLPNRIIEIRQPGGVYHPNVLPFGTHPDARVVIVLLESLRPLPRPLRKPAPLNKTPGANAASAFAVGGACRDRARLGRDHTTTTLSGVFCRI
eukprot:3937610-Rhodomonas_salina.4